MKDLTVSTLKCEYRTNPLGLDVRKPRFSWTIASHLRGTMQSAYQVQVTEEEDNFSHPLWDSGQVVSDQAIHVEYDGPELQSRKRYWYRVKIWDNHERESAWSESAWWETALFSHEDWQAQWITPDPKQLDPNDEPVYLLRKAFTINDNISSARIYTTGVGLYELSINGQRVGDECFAPGWTSYDHRLQYQTYDVTAQLKAGNNAIGVMLANGWYKGELGWSDSVHRNIFGEQRAALLQLHIQFADGTEDIIVTDPSWRASLGPIVYSEIYHGETYDARLEQPGWDEASFDDTDWSDTIEVTLPKTHLVAQENSPTRVTETLRPIASITTPAGEKVLDMGQNMVGRMRFKVHAEAGTVIRLTHAEVLDKEGNFYIDNLREARQTVEYTAKGDIENGEEFAPTFSFQGFRYVKVEGYPTSEDGLPLENFLGEVIHSDMEQTGEFTCSHPMVNQLQNNIVWGQRGNFLDVPTDCPQRNERMGWTGDAQVFMGTAAFNYNIGPFFTKWLRDLSADQREDGGVPFVIPFVPGDHFGDSDNAHSSAAWGDAATISPWAIYSWFGDKRLLAEQYESMKAWVSYIRQQGEHEFLWNTGFHFGDWLGLDAKENSYVGATPRDFIATAYYAHSTRLVRDAAIALGKSADTKHYTELLHHIIRHFTEEFVTANGRLASPTQTAHALALVFELVEGEVRDRVARDLNELVVTNNYHLTTGFVGTPHLCMALSDHGYHDTALKLLVQEQYPSWLYPITKGATTIWEHWDGIKPDGSFWSADMNSYNHYAYGAIGEWLYRKVAGLDFDVEHPGFKNILIHPLLGGSELTSAQAAYTSMHGQIVSGWHVTDGKTTIYMTIPPNTTAEVTLPQATLENVLESGHPLAIGEGIYALKQLADGVQLQIGSGEYQFVY